MGNFLEMKTFLDVRAVGRDLESACNTRFERVIFASTLKSLIFDFDSVRANCRER